MRTILHVRRRRRRHCRWGTPRDVASSQCLHNPFENHLRSCLAQRERFFFTFIIYLIFFFFCVLFMFSPYAHNKWWQWVTELAYTYTYTSICTCIWAHRGTIWCEKDLKVDIDKWGAHQVFRAFIVSIFVFFVTALSRECRVLLHEDLKEIIYDDDSAYVRIRSRVVRFKYCD